MKLGTELDALLRELEIEGQRIDSRATASLETQTRFGNRHLEWVQHNLDRRGAEILRRRNVHQYRDFPRESRAGAQESEARRIRAPGAIDGRECDRRCRQPERTL